jgi:hypothetical protein
MMKNIFNFIFIKNVLNRDCQNYYFLKILEVLRNAHYSYLQSNSDTFLSKSSKTLNFELYSKSLYKYIHSEPLDSKI